MSAATSIEWTDRTWNPVRGCSRVSEGCRNCYAERIAGRFSGPGLHSNGFVTRTPSGARWTGKVELQEQLLHAPLHWKKPSRIFVNSMSDLFHEALPFSAIARVIDVIASAPQHTFQVLTKRPARAFHFFGEIGVTEGLTAPPNLWLGVSVEDQATAKERIPDLLRTPVALRFVSYEPALGPVDLTVVQTGAIGRDSLRVMDRWSGERHLGWVIVGGESGPGARPFDIAWARTTVKQCQAARVPVFVKQLGGFPVMPDREWRETQPTRLLSYKRERDTPDGLRAIVLNSSKGADMSEWPEELRVREFPTA